VTPQHARDFDSTVQIFIVIVIVLLMCWQERDLKTFHEGLKQDVKLMKQSVDMLPKDMRKDVLRQRKEEKDIEQAEKVMDGCSTDSWAQPLCALYVPWSVWH